MICKIVIALTCLMVLVDSNPTFTSRAQIVELEEGCVRQGGICKAIEDCEPGNLVTVPVILCPLQDHLGARCCYL